MMYMIHRGRNMYVFHGAFFIRYTSQDAAGNSGRGGNKFDAPNWFMFMLRHELDAKNLLSFQSMFSLDPLTEKNGYPLLFQTGETYHDEPLVDRQHPHDLFATLAVNYTHSFSKKIDANFYFGYPGEPALGPGAFMHRVSAMNNPDAPLAHHWQDATHITYGTATLGLRYQMLKAEASLFTGREPDENRYDFDKARFDSHSFRLSINPNKNLSAQISLGYIKSPEAMDPDLNITRTTASVLHSVFLGKERFISSAMVYGVNHMIDGMNMNSFSVESTLQLQRHSFYLRYEFIQKDADELMLIDFADDPLFDIQAFTLGISRIIWKHARTAITLGVQGTINFPAEELRTVYGDRPLAAEVYLRISPAAVLD